MQFPNAYPGTRALAYVNAQHTRLVSHNNVEHKRYKDVARDISAVLTGNEAMLDGEMAR